MGGRRFGLAFSFALGLSLGGCAGTIGLYHDVEGGAISQTRQPPPGLDQPYPNLADVPAAHAAAPAGAQAAITAQAQSGVSAPAPGALAGLLLPTAAPPLPDVPGLNLPAEPSPAPGPVFAGPMPLPAIPAPLPAAAAIGFAPGSAVLPPSEAAKIGRLATARGQTDVLAGGFGEGSLTLALARARRLADALTADGVPGQNIRLDAMAAGSGGFVQLVY